MTGKPTIDRTFEKKEDQKVTAVVRLPEPDLPEQSASAQISTLQQNAAQAQKQVTDFARGRSGVEVKRQFWITNAVVLSVDRRKTSLEEIATIPEVTRIHRDFEVEALDSPSSTQTGDVGTTDNGSYTYGLDQIDAPEVWQQFGTKGGGARVAVLDTGVDPDHPDIDLSGWAEFDDSGNQIDSDPYDSGEHGTHVSGTVSGGAESGEHIGVAPDVELYHGLVLPGGFGSFSQIIGGIEWAVDNNCDVINMSLGGGGYSSEYIDPLQNAISSGTLPVCAAGNDSEGTSGSPGNVYGASLAVGASDSNQDITDFSSGEKIVTDDAWGSNAGSDWPAEYIVPDVAAPGNAVKSSLPGGDYGTKPGTSMASPHVAGVAALMVAASGGDVTPTEIWDYLENTAWKPDSWDPGTANAVIDGKDTRYGKGIVDAPAAVELAAVDTGVTGTIESGGQPAEDATVELGGFSVETDSTGTFEITAAPGQYELTVSGTGIAQKTLTVTVEDSGSLTDLGTITVDPTLEVAVLDGQQATIEGGDSVTVTFDAYNVETMQVDLVGTYAESDASLLVDGQSVEFGDEVSFSDYTGELTVTVETTSETSGSLGLEQTVTGAGDSTTVSTGPSTVLETFRNIGVIDANGAFASDIVDDLEAQLGPIFQASTTTTSSVIDNPGAYDGLVVQDLDGSLVSEFVNATDSSDTGVVYLDQWGSDSNAIPQYAGVSSKVTDTFEADSFSDGVETPVYYEPTADHPIVDGFDTGTEVLIHEAEYADHSWFETTSDFDVLATVNHGGGTAGDALAVDQGTQTVLASTLGRSTWVDGTLTTDANRILTAAAVYAATGDELALAARGETGVSPGGTATVDLEGLNLETAMVTDIWVDWETANAATNSVEAVDNSISTEGEYIFDWSDPQMWAQPSLTLSLPDRYVGGEYVLTVTAAAGGGTVETANSQDTVETTAILSME